MLQLTNFDVSILCYFLPLILPCASAFVVCHAVNLVNACPIADAFSGVDLFLLFIDGETVDHPVVPCTEDHVVLAVS